MFSDVKDVVVVIVVVDYHVRSSNSKVCPLSQTRHIMLVVCCAKLLLYSSARISILDFAHHGTGRSHTSDYSSR